LGEWVFGWKEYIEVINMKMIYISKVTSKAIYGNRLISEEMKSNAYQNSLLEFGIYNGSFPSTLYKFRNIDNRTLDIIKNREFYFSSPKNFNDPFDCNLFYKKSYSKKEILEDYSRFIQRNSSIKLDQIKQKFGMNSGKFFFEHQKMNEKLINGCGIFSLSRECNNITMWSHYADNHKGLVFELDILKDINFFRLFGLVKYETEYELLSYAKDNREELVKLFLTKYVDWEYEQEVRIIDYSRNGLRKFNKETIRTIIFGYKTSQEDIKSIIKLCNEEKLFHVKFKKAKLVPGKFAIDFDEINKNNYLEN
jgi:hypothetical protein